MTLVVRIVLVVWLLVLTLGLAVVWSRRSSEIVESVVEEPQRKSCAVFFFNYNIRRVAAD